MRYAALAFVFAILKSGESADDSLKAELNRHVRREIGPIANLDAIFIVNALPKTRSQNCAVFCAVLLPVSMSVSVICPP